MLINGDKYGPNINAETCMMMNTYVHYDALKLSP